MTIILSIFHMHYFTIQKLMKNKPKWNTSLVIELECASMYPTATDRPMDVDVSLMLKVDVVWPPSNSFESGWMPLHPSHEHRHTRVELGTSADCSCFPIDRFTHLAYCSLCSSVTFLQPASWTPSIIRITSSSTVQLFAGTDPSIIIQCLQPPTHCWIPVLHSVSSNSFRGNLGKSSTHSNLGA